MSWNNFFKPTYILASCGSALMNPLMIFIKIIKLR
ncbi:mechanosensitive ion channel protein MscS [Morganella morganii]|nr:mechanosensitive ion channel protein MscS [Morganella morganii]